MIKTPDFTKAFQDMVSAFPFDASAFQNAWSSQAAFGEKLSKVAFDAAGKTTDISANWARETIAQLADVTAVKADPADYSRGFGSFATSAAELAATNLAAFSEVAKKMQQDTVELVLAAGREASDTAGAAAKRAAADVTSVARKAAAAA